MWNIKGKVSHDPSLIVLINIQKHLTHKTHLCVYEIRCIQQKGEKANECEKIGTHLRSMCPTKWVSKIYDWFMFITQKILMKLHQLSNFSLHYSKRIMIHWFHSIFLLKLFKWWILVLLILNFIVFCRFQNGIKREKRGGFLKKYRLKKKTLYIDNLLKRLAYVSSWICFMFFIFVSSNTA